MRRDRIIYFLFYLLALPLLATPATLKRGDIRATMDEIFAYHIEQRELTPLLVKRSVKVYIEQFPLHKIYLMQSEVSPFVEITPSMASAAIEEYRQDRFTIFARVNQQIRQAIERARMVRQAMKIEEIQPVLFERDNGSYSSSKGEIQERMKRQFAAFLYLEKSSEELTLQQKEKLFALWDKRLKSIEDPYLANDKREEHLLTLHILKAYAKSLDAHTAYFSPQEALELRTLLEKQFEGIGVVLKEGTEGVYIAGLVAGGPAERSGKIAEGDLVVSVDGRSTLGIPYEEVIERFKGGKGERISLKLKRKSTTGEESFFLVDLNREKITMEADRIKYASLPHADGWIGVINLPSFYENNGGLSCERDLREALRELKKQGRLLGLIIDLRENAGGFLSQAVKVAGLFITNGVIVISKYAEGEIHYLRAIDGRNYYNGPLLILTSKASASAAEIVAQALQDYGAALVAGDERTYGKGTIQYQTITDESSKNFFKVTVGRYYTVSGKSTQIDGVQADIQVPSQYIGLRIGERFLEYPLPSDQLPPAYVDSLSDLDPRMRPWFQKNYLPQIYKRQSYWRKMLPILNENSAYRLSHNKNFTLFLQEASKAEVSEKQSDWGVEDLQIQEAVNIVKDMIFLQSEHPSLELQHSSPMK